MTVIYVATGILRKSLQLNIIIIHPLMVIYDAYSSGREAPRPHCECAVEHPWMTINKVN